MSTDVTQREVDEAVARQAERLARKEERPQSRSEPAGASVSAPEGVAGSAPTQVASAPSVVRELRVRVMSDGNVTVEGPLDDPSAVYDLILQTVALYGQMREEHVRQRTLSEVQKQARAPFMQRIIQGLRNKTRQ